MDNLTPEQRRRTMQAVKSSGTSLELKLAIALWHKGYRYRKNYKGVTGTPDIAFPRLRIAIFCDSEFWHGYKWEERKSTIKSNIEYWHRKIERTIARDHIVNEKLRSEGWLVLRFWGKELECKFEACMQIVENAISNRRQNTSMTNKS